MKQHFRRRSDVVVEGDMFLYYAEGQEDERRVHGKRVGKFVSPNVIVVPDHDLGGRGTYKLWVEGKPPDFAMDVISPLSEIRNHEDKKALYARLGFGQYFLFQPDARRPGPRLGPEVGLPEAVRSPALGVSLRPEAAFLRVRDERSGTDYLWSVEWIDAIEVDAAARREAAAARQATDLAAEMEAAERMGEAARRALEVAQLEAEHKADREAAARKAAEARLAAIRARLGCGRAVKHGRRMKRSRSARRDTAREESVSPTRTSNGCPAGVFARLQGALVRTCVV